MTRDNNRSTEWIAKKINEQDQRLKSLEIKPKLAHSSIDDGSLVIMDADGIVSAIIGKQEDGTFVAASVNGPTPPTPSAPNVTASTGNITVSWNGGFEDEEDATPMDFAHVEVHMSVDEDFEPDLETLAGVITSKSGGSKVTSPEYGEWFICLVAKSQSDKASDPSAVVATVLRPLVDEPDIAGAIDEIYEKVAEEATKAQASADGKNSIWHMGTAPVNDPLKPHKVGDIWFDTANGNRINKWDGTSWVSATIGIEGLGSDVTTAIENAKTKAEQAQAAADQVTSDLALAESDFATQILATNNSVVTAKQESATDAQAKATQAKAEAVAAAKIATDLAAAGAKQEAIDAAKIDAQTKATAAQNAAIASAQADATAKAEAAKTAAINSAAQDAQAKADAVKAIADAANQAAADAAGIANGKGKVLVQSTAPGLADRNTNTLWIDTTGGANTPKKWTTGTTWIAVTDKATTDAATAAATAKSAADAADAKAVTAQTAAGTAQTTANSALTMAGSKTNVFYSTNPATGTGTRVDDIWRQRNAQDEIIAEWRWVGGATGWQKITLTSGVFSNLDAGLLTAGTIQADRIGAQSITANKILAKSITANEIKAGAITSASGVFGTVDASVLNAGTISADRLNANDIRAKFLNAGKITATDIVAGTITAESGIIGSVDLGTATVGKLNGKYIEAKTISVDHLLVGSFDNLVPDPMFSNKLGDWPMGGIHSVDPTGGRDGKTAYKQITNATQAGMYANQLQQTNPGQSYKLSVWVKSSVALPINSIGLYARSLQANGTAVIGADNATFNHPAISANVWTEVKGTVPTRAGAVWVTFGVYTQSNTPNGATVLFDSFYASKAVDASLIVDGALDAKIITGATITGGTINGAAFNYTGTGAGTGYDVSINRDSAGSLISFTTPLSTTVGSIRATDEGGLILRTPATAAYPLRGYLRMEGNVSSGAGIINSNCDIFMEGKAPTLTLASTNANITVGTAGSITGMGALTIESTNTMYLKGMNGADFSLGYDSSARLFSMGIYDRTYTNAANMYITSAGTIGRSTSSIRNKLVVETLPGTMDDKILSLRSVSWFDKTESEKVAEYYRRIAENDFPVDEDGNVQFLETPNELRRIPGMIAEEVLAAGLGEFVHYGENGKVEGLMYDRLGVALIPVVARQRDRIDELGSSVQDLTTRLANLEARFPPEA
ncbi:hypothetical protein ACFY5D_16625 [Paeniglutamicibacter sp. NPDC012692]|uniref:hypothetical protein n=1 Tax=Paeniglutamicibacter sp. NPDC012692 TaxID=3364388 RepID=UPI0036A11FD5